MLTFSGTLLVDVLGVVLLSTMMSFFVVNRAELIFEKNTGKILVLSVLVAVSACGLLSVCALLAWSTRSEGNMSFDTESESTPILKSLKTNTAVNERGNQNI